MAKKLRKEVGLEIAENQITRVGGFYNRITNALVVLHSLDLTADQIVKSFDQSVASADNNLAGTYVGSLEGTLDRYRAFPEAFAGGKAAYSTNFPSNAALMQQLSQSVDSMRAPNQ